MFMALAPGEVFQHTHNQSSVTMLVSGDVTLEMQGERTSLSPGTATPVDAFVAHTLVNVGRALAVVECMHRQGDTPGEDSP